MYEHLRSDLVTKISNQLSQEQLDIVLRALDNISSSYEIAEKSTELVVQEDRAIQLVKVYLVAKKIEGLSDKTLYNYGRHLDIFFTMIGKPIENITTNDIRIFLYNYQKQRGITDRSLDKVRMSINVFFQWCINEEYLYRNPCRTIHKIKYEVKPRVALTQMELELIRRSCKNKRDLAIVEVLYSTGCRVSELVGIKMDDVDFKTKQVHLFEKGKKHRNSFLNAKAELALREYLADRNDDCEYIFVSSRSPYRQLKKEAVEKIIRELSSSVPELKKRLTPHVFRHTTATTGIRNGMKPESLQIMLGHEKIDTTMIYAKADLNDVQSQFNKTII